jgi:hypothetical protein
VEGNRGTSELSELRIGIVMKNVNWFAWSVAIAFVALVWIPYLILTR